MEPKNKSPLFFFLCVNVDCGELKVASEITLLDVSFFTDTGDNNKKCLNITFFKHHLLLIVWGVYHLEGYLVHVKRLISIEMKHTSSVTINNYRECC